MASLIRERSSYSLKEVPGIFQSDSVIEPDAPLRPTQSNIGYFLSLDTDAAFGAHKNEYSGIGGQQSILSPGEVFTVPRSHHHIKSGLHSSPQLPMASRSLINTIKSNEGLFATPIGKVGQHLFELSEGHRSKPLPRSVEKQLFPRSIVYELDYTKAINKNAMLEALEKERAKFEQSVKEKKNKAEPSLVQPPEQRKEIQVVPPKPSLEISRKQLKREITDKACGSVCGPCGCVLTRGKCPKCHKSGDSTEIDIAKEEVSGFEGKPCKKWPSEPPRYGSSWEDKRKAELLRVGYPFAQEAASWLYCTIKPIDMSNLYRPSKKRFPERSFSSLNI